MSTSVATPSPTKNRFFLVFIIALFVAPLLAAWLLVGRWQPGATSNHGELLNPAQPVHHLSLRTRDGDTLDTSYLRGRWTLTYVGSDAACLEPCRTGLYNIRQVRLALGKDRDRAQTLMALPAPPNAELSEWLQRQHATPQTVVACSCFNHSLSSVSGGAGSAIKVCARSLSLPRASRTCLML